LGGIGAQSVIALLDQGGSFIQVQQDKTGTLLASEGAHPVIVYYHDIKTNEMILRHLMPLEDERLQGFPDNWTKVPYNGKPLEKCPDSVRYKAIGNSMAVPVMRWIGERIKKIELLFNDTQSPGGEKC
jgi:site-specific DNA-cytosine methylase